MRKKALGNLSPHPSTLRKRMNNNKSKDDQKSRDPFSPEKSDYKILTNEKLNLVSLYDIKQLMISFKEENNFRSNLNTDTITPKWENILDSPLQKSPNYENEDSESKNSINLDSKEKNNEHQNLIIFPKEIDLTEIIPNESQNQINIDNQHVELEEINQNHKADLVNITCFILIINSLLGESKERI